MTPSPKVERLAAPRPTDEPCLVCGNRAGNAVVLRALHYKEERGYVELASCGGCGSAFYLHARDVHVAYPSNGNALDDPEFVLLLHHYQELVSGLDWKISLLERFRPRAVTSVLEVGANMGVALDYCRTAWGADVVGLEPSSYGLGGRALLGVPIENAFLEHSQAARGRSFDFVFATEVIEHVDDPARFLAELSDRLAPSGVLLLTSPRAEAIDEPLSAGEIYAALSAGAHQFLYSEAAFRRALADAGFTHVHTEPLGMTRVVVASREPLQIAPPPSVPERMYRYYRGRLERPTGNARVDLAHAIAAYVCGRELRLHDEVAQLPSVIERGLRDTMGLDLSDVEPAARALAGAKTLFDIGRCVPFHLPLYLRARASQLAGRDPLRASRLRALCRVICAEGLRVDFQNLFLYDPIRTSLRRSLPLALAGLAGLEPVSSSLRRQASAAAERVPELVSRAEDWRDDWRAIKSDARSRLGLAP